MRQPYFGRSNAPSRLCRASTRPADLGSNRHASSGLRSDRRDPGVRRRTGVKLRMLFAVPRADDRTFFYGVNFELSYNAKHWDPTRDTSEIRPIIGWHLQ